VRSALAIASICLAAALGACGDDDDESASDSTATDQAAPTTERVPSPPADACTEAQQPPAAEREGEKPKGKLASGEKHRLVVTTNCGEFTIALDTKTAPNAAASLVALAKAKYFDKTVFHRIVPDFVIQGGDPTASGSGGPGYSTVDEPPSDAQYPKGTVAMAKAGDEPPGTAGSQFFVMTGDRGLPPEYAIVGKVTDGLEVVEKIGALGDPATEQPTTLVVIESVKAQSS
jgi:cyclophilin family peptidyl-prolyl cis-trans isomerase